MAQRRQTKLQNASELWFLFVAVAKVEQVIVRSGDYGHLSGFMNSHSVSSDCEIFSLYILKQ